MVRLLKCTLLVVMVMAVRAHDYYRNSFPNGFSVPNPCGSGIWGAVGHFDPNQHTQNKNQFGLDFSANGHMWDSVLCQKDSDGDGVINGVELGDPNCVWKNGTAPEGAATGHPGICEPIGVGKCADKAFSCGCNGANCIG